MPHPQDVAVPSLPLSETLALAIKLGVANVDFEEQAEIDGFLHTFGNACYEAGRAAGRASAEPEGFVLVRAEKLKHAHQQAKLAADLIVWFAKDNPNKMCGYLDDSCSAASIAAKDIEAMLAAAPTPTASIAPQHCQCPACIGGTMHASDCAVHGRDSGAGIIRGSCDCGAESIAPKAEALPLAPAYAPCAEEPDGRCCGTGECWTCPLAASVTQAPKAEGEAS